MAKDQFQQIVAERVRNVLENPTLVAGRPSRTPLGLAGAALNATCDRLIEVVPHYSIEAWLLHNKTVARDLASRHGASATLQEFLAGEVDSEEVEKVKDHAWSGAMNGDLAATWTARLALPNCPSFRALARKLANRRDIRIAAKGTRGAHDGAARP